MTFDIEGNEESLKKNTKQALVLALIDVRDNFKELAIRNKQSEKDWDEATRQLTKEIKHRMEAEKIVVDISTKLRTALLAVMSLGGWTQERVQHVMQRVDKYSVIERQGQDAETTELPPEEILFFNHLLHILDCDSHPKNNTEEFIRGMY